MSSTYYLSPLSMSFAACCGMVVVATLVLTALYGLYNIYLHPLRNYPGPKLWTAFRLPYSISTWQGTLPFKVLAFHEHYGPVVRIAPNELAFTDAAAWDDIQGLRPGRRQNRKDLYAYGPQQGDGTGNIVIAPDANHARLRRLYAPAFTPKAVEEQSEMLIKYSNLLVKNLKKAVANGESVQDMSDWFNFTTFDLTGEFAFSEPFHCLETGGYHFFMKIVFEGVIAGLRIMQLERWKIWTLMQPLIPKSAFQAKVDMDSYCAALVDRRTERGHIKGCTDVFNYLLVQPKTDDKPLTRDELVDNGIVLVVAGSETTATLLTGVTYLLARNKDKHERVVEEVRTRFNTDDEITPQTVNSLEYMIAVLSEALRVFPPTPFGFPRVIDTPGGQSVAGYHVPENTCVAVFHWAAYHSSANFHRSEEFIPERWLKPTPAEFVNDNHAVVQPFHVGPRACLGKSLAYAEMRLLLAKMLFHFDFELEDATQDWISGLKGFSVWERTPMRVRLQPVSRG